MVEQRVEVKVVSVHVKVCDRGNYEFKTPTGTVLKELDEECVPSFFPGEHYGDYLILDIDLETGQITNWKKPTTEQIEQVINGDDE
jgi:hypothetical protein